MRVTCDLCKFESAGACTKKKQGGEPKKVKLTKRRVCGIYQEDPMKVFTSFRKKEAHRSKMREASIRRAKVASALSDLQKRKDSADV